MANRKSESDWKDGFLFVANHPALDFLNTRPVLNGEKNELLPDFTALLRWLGAAGFLGAREISDTGRAWRESARARRAVEAMHRLREKLRKEILIYENGGGVSQSTVKELNRIMADRPMRTKIKASESGFSMESFCDPSEPEDLLAPLAHSAAQLLADFDRSRIRKCRQCALHFLDTSKKGTRVWCSMQLCGNRAKVAAYAARQRQRSSGGTGRP